VPSSHPVHLTTLGGFALAIGDRIGVPPKTRHARTLLACLAYHPGRVFARDELADRFWPDVDPDRGRANLATALWAVRRALEPDAGALLQATRSAVSLTGDVRVDATAFEDGIGDPDVRVREAALRLYRGDFLPEHIDPWSVAQRERLAMAYEAALLSAAREKHDPELAWKSLERNPYAEDAYAILVDHALKLGNRATARGLLARWKAAMNEIEAAPDDAFADLSRVVDATPSTTDASVLPTMLSSFVGRVDETARLTDALARSRLITVTGPGGAGKTRLALHVARAHAADFAGGVHFVDLVAVARERVADALASAFGADSDGGDPMSDAVRYVAARTSPCLVVVDNCELLLDDLSAYLATLLAASPQVRFLLTSREPLRAEGEAVVPLPPLSPPDAVALFLDRAREAGATLGEDAETRAAVTAICTRLDGIPLALELAAARAAAVPLREYDRLLADRFAFLGGARRGVRPAHRTLRALYDESFERLDSDERKVFRRMACVAAPWSGDALSWVCTDDETATSRAYAALWRLVEKSLVASESDGERARYRLLESSRAYAAERLAEAGDRTIALTRHFAFLLTRAEAAEQTFVRDGEATWEAPARAWAAERDHVMQALAWAIEDPARIRGAIALIQAGRRIWARFGPFVEVARLIRLCLAAMPPDVDPLPHGLVWSALCDIETTKSRYEQAAEAAEHAIELLRGRAPVPLSRVYVHYVGMLLHRGDPRSALVWPHAVAAARAANDDASIWFLLVTEATLAIDALDGDLNATELQLTEALAIAERMQRRLYIAVTRGYRARVDGRRGRFAIALEASHAAVRMLREMSAHIYLTDLLVQTAWLSRESGALREACALASEAIALRSHDDNDSVVLAATDEYAAALHALGDSERAAVLRGYADHRGSLIAHHVRDAVHGARHAALGVALQASHPVAYARGARAELHAIV
jgi:predicted ATPase/DNA-binding SARP family transcriptional activator